MGKEILKLQNGSDIRGIAMNGVDGEDVHLTRYNALAIGAAFAHWLGFKVGKNSFDLKICVGRDNTWLISCAIASMDKSVGVNM